MVLVSLFPVRYGSGGGYSATYWLFLVMVAMSLSAGAGCAIFGVMHNSNASTRADPIPGVCALVCFLLAAVTSYTCVYDTSQLMAAKFPTLPECPRKVRFAASGLFMIV